MKFTEENVFKRKINSFLQRIRNRINNANNCNIQTNGEMNLLDFVIYASKNTPVCVFDVGSNKGDYTISCLRVAEKHHKSIAIHAFEPNSKSYADLTKLCADYNNVKINKAIVSETQGTEKIYFDNQGTTIASLYVRDGFNQNEEVNSITLENYISENNIEKIDLIKLDVEGHEYSCIKGLGNMIKSNKIDYIQFEYGATYIDAGRFFKNIYDLLSEHWDIYRLRNNALEKVVYRQTMEDFQYANFVAKKKK